MPNQLLSATTSLKNTVYGVLGASGDLSMNLGDASAMTRSLNGNLSLSLTKGRLAHVNLIQQLSSIGKFLGGAGGGQNATNIEKLGGDLRMTNGLGNDEQSPDADSGRHSFGSRVRKSCRSKSEHETDSGDRPEVARDWAAQESVVTSKPRLRTRTANW